MDAANAFRPNEAGALALLSDRDQEILAFERQWWKYAGAKEQAIRELFDMSATRYYQVLNALIDRPGGARRRPDAGQAAAPAALGPAAGPLRPPTRHRGLTGASVGARHELTRSPQPPGRTPHRPHRRRRADALGPGRGRGRRPVTSLAVWRGEDPGQPSAAASTTSPTAAREAISQASGQHAGDQQGRHEDAAATASTPPLERRGPGHRRGPRCARSQVVVLNQTSRSGLAGSVADQLRGKGWTVPAVGNFRGIVPATTVYYPAGAGGRRAGSRREPADVAADPAAVRQPVDVPAHRGRHRLVPGLSAA